MGIKLNFGGFIPLSTVDWRGRAVCTVFLRGCPLRCSYCQNEAIQSGRDLRDIAEVTGMMRASAPFVSGVMFSGGEPAAQEDALVALAEEAKGMGLAVGIQTSGLFSKTLGTLIRRKLADKIAIDYKTRWEEPGIWEPECALLRERYEKNIRQSIESCKKGSDEGILSEFEVVITVFKENEHYIKKISDENRDVSLVLQQGEYKVPMMPEDIVNITEYISRRQNLIQQYTPMTLEDIEKIAGRLKRDVRIRTRQIGEVTYRRRFLL